MSLTITDPDGTRPMLAARSPELAADLLEAWRLHAQAQGGRLDQDGPGTWLARNARGTAYARLTLTQEAHAQT